MATRAEENYLKAIFKLSGQHNRAVSTNAIADELHTKASSVTDMMKKLSDKKLIHYTKYQGVTLTRKGKALATTVVRKHRLWEVFLVDKLNFKWDEIHELAEQLEHIESKLLIDKLDQFLGYPKYDPHGDPIPDKNGTIDHHKELTISDLSVGDKGVIVGVKEHSADFLQYLDGVKLIPGARIVVKKRYDYDLSLIIDIGGEELMVSDQVSKRLFVEKTK